MIGGHGEMFLDGILLYQSDEKPQSTKKSDGGEIQKGVNSDFPSAK